MIPAKQLLGEIVGSLRNVIAPAITEPYPKAQAYMAAVILEFIAQQVEERSDIAEGKQAAIAALFNDLSPLLGSDRVASKSPVTEEGLSQVIEQLYTERRSLGEEVFTAANLVVRRGLRQLLDQELKVARKGED